MLISLITETYPPEVNGVAMTLQQLVKGLAARGHEVQIIRPRQNADDHARTEGVVQHLPVRGVPLPRYEGLRMGLPAKRFMVNAWRDRRPDVIHVATEGPLGLSAMWAAKRLAVPTTSSFHTNFHQYSAHYGFGFARGIAIRYLRFVHAYATSTLVPSSDVQLALQADGFKNVFILARGVDTSLFSPARRDEALRQEWGVAPEDLVVVYVGRIAEEKNIPLTVRAFERLRQVRPDAKLVIVGDGPIRPALQKQHPEYIFAGMRHGEDLARHYASGDVFLFGSVTETFGNVVTEAMGSGLAVLAYDYAAPRQFIRSGENGVKVAFNDENAFIEAAGEMVKDKAQLRKMRENARKTVEAQSWDHIIARYESLLLDIAENGRVTREHNGSPATGASGSGNGNAAEPDQSAGAQAL